MQNLAEFFSRLNDVAFPYVVLRNWENLPYAVETGIHSDLDLLVYDLDHFIELNPFLTRVYPHPRVQFRLPIEGDSFIQLDARYIGDGYYPGEFEENIIKTREWNTNGFWTPNPLHHRIGLAYHCVHHKNANTYKNFLGNLSVAELLEALKKNKEFSWVEPEDPSVGRFNKYVRGATAIVEGSKNWVEKKQYNYLKYNLIDNEEDMLNKLNSRHFPKVVGRENGTIRIEHCGAPLMPDNLPKDWKEQLYEILRELEKSGIVHRDVRKDNLMVKNGVIMLLDFGWAKEKKNKEEDHPDLLGFPNKCPLGFDDTYSMNRVIKQIEAELEELCVPQ